MLRKKRIFLIKKLKISVAFEGVLFGEKIKINNK